MKIAWFTPFGPKSSIGHYSEVIVNELALDDDVTVFAPRIEGEELRPCAVPIVGLPPIPPDDVIRSLDDFDALVYNLGDYLHYHLPIFEALQRKPGVVILHDLVMRDFFLGYFFLHVKKPEGLVSHLAYCHGEEAAHLGRDLITGRRPETLDDPMRLQYPMFKSAVHNALAVVTHSEYTRGRLAAEIAVPVCKLDFPIHGPATAYIDKPPVRRRRDDGRIGLLTFGVLNPNKVIHATIEAIAGTATLRETVRFIVVGDGQPEYVTRLRELVASHSLEDVVELVGWRPDDELREELERADVVVNLRNPHLGESSGSLLNSLVAGVATVVWDQGFYGEFPDDVVCKVRAESEVQGVLERLAGDEAYRTVLGAAGRAHALARFDTAAYCAGIRRFIGGVRSAAPVAGLADRVSAGLIEMGSNGLDNLADYLAGEIAALAGGSKAA
jgi:glycosyltransferase involved in cell wall biosynthesis